MEAQKDPLNKIFKGNLVIAPEKKIRTMEFSPSFSVIKAMSTSNSENVSQLGLEPLRRYNRLISEAK